jgi:hypothetical protein
VDYSYPSREALQGRDKGRVEVEDVQALRDVHQPQRRLVTPHALKADERET